MIKFAKLVQSYLLYAFPFVIACMAWSSFQTAPISSIQNSFLTRAAWEILSWNLMIWFLVLLSFLILLIVHRSTREVVMTRLTRMKERDEREQLITAQAARSSFLVTLSLLILLLFVSVLTVDIVKISDSEARDGRTKSLSIGFNLSLLDRSEKASAISDAGTVFESNGIPISKSAIVLLIMACQVGIFGWSARRQHLHDSND